MSERGGEDRGGEGCGNECKTGIGRRRMGMYLIETMIFLACISGIFYFYSTRQCHMDSLFLLLWGAALLVLVPLLIRGEMQLFRKEKQAKQLWEPRHGEADAKHIQKGKKD